jgi:integrase
VTVRRCIATLSSALNDAIRQRRLTHNAARYTAVPLPHRVERPCWSVEETAAFLRYCHQVDDPFTELYELLIYTGMRKGEVLGLHWADVDLDARLLFVRKHRYRQLSKSRRTFACTRVGPPVLDPQWRATACCRVISSRRSRDQIRELLRHGPAPR